MNMLSMNLKTGQLVKAKSPKRRPTLTKYVTVKDGQSYRISKNSLGYAYAPGCSAGPRLQDAIETAKDNGYEVVISPLEK